MATRIGTREVRTKLSEILDLATRQGQRFVVERRGKPVAAVVSVDDLERLEALDAGQYSEQASRTARLRQAFEEAGVEVRWPAGQPVSASERRPITVPGRPLSEDIIADRR